MAADGTTEKLRLGFLTAVEVPQRGYVGGLLVTNHLGRPLEFQCTTPVQPNRTQQILYGPTLLPFILTELIGKTLLDKVGVKPDLVLIDRPDLLNLREHVSIPVACLDEIRSVGVSPAQAASHDCGAGVSPAQGASENRSVGVSPAQMASENRSVGVSPAQMASENAGESCSRDGCTTSADENRGDDETCRMTIGRQTLRFHAAHARDQQSLEKKSHLIPRGADLLEPFERVREALQETTAAGAKR